MSETHLYTNPSNARRAARQAGYELDQVDIIQDGARFRYQPKVAIETDEGAEHTYGAVEPMQTVESAGVSDPDDVIEGTEPQEDVIEGTEQESDTVVAAEPLPIADRIAAMNSDSIVMLIGADDSDYGMCKWTEAEGMAARLAGSEGIAINVVDPTDSAVLCTVAPEGVEAAGEVEGEQGDTEASAEADQSEAEGPAEAEPAAPVEQTVTELFHQAGDRAIQLEQRSAEGLVLMIDGVVVYRENKVRKASKANATPREPRAAKTEPEGKYKLIVELCCRENGASPQELHEATGWTGAPWKWLLTNPKGTGLAQKYGYDFVASKDGRNVRYLLVKQEAGQAQAA